MMARRVLPLLLALPLLLLAACDSQSSLTAPESTSSAATASSTTPSSTAPNASRPDLEPLVEKEVTKAGATATENTQAYLARLNEKLADKGMNVAVQKAEWMTGSPKSNGAGQTVLANDRNLRLDAQWVPGDERRNADGDKLTHVAWAPFTAANVGTPNQFDALSLIETSLNTWDDVNCSKLDIETQGTTNQTPSTFFLGGDPFLADITTTGFFSGRFIDTLLGPGASESVLGVTFTSVFTNPETGEPTDVNNDGNADIAFKEVIYNDAFQWATNPSEGVDTETIALHENGHALGLGHFGKVHITGNKPKNRKLHVSPRAVMNASYLGGATREPLGTDNGAFCGLYASWGK